MEITEILKFPHYALTTDTFSQYVVNFEECIPVGCVPSATVGTSTWGGGRPSGEVSALGGVCLGGCLPRGVSARGWVDRQTPVKTLPFHNYCCGR